MNYSITKLRTLEYEIIRLSKYKFTFYLYYIQYSMKDSIYKNKLIRHALFKKCK